MRVDKRKCIKSVEKVWDKRRTLIKNSYYLRIVCGVSLSQNLIYFAWMVSSSYAEKYHMLNNTKFRILHSIQSVAITTLLSIEFIT
jgi:hypothetical protein